MSKFYPLDIEALVKLGGYEFIKQNPVWIVDGGKFCKETDKFFRNFIRNVEKINDKKKKVFYADYGFIFFIAQKAHILLAKAILKNKNKKILSFNNSAQFLSKDKSLRSVSYLNKEKNYNFLFKVKILFKREMINFFLKRNFFFNRPTYLDYGGTSIFKIEYAKANKINLVKDYENFIFDFKNKKNNYNFYWEIANRLIKTYQERINNIFGTNVYLQDLISIWADRLSSLDYEINNCLKKLSKFDGALIENTSKPTSRALSYIYQIQNKNTIAFDHGGIPHSSKYIYCALEPLSYNSFITISKKSKESIQRSIINYFGPKKLKSVKIDFFKSEKNFKKIYLAKKLENIKKKIKKIMIIGWAMNSRRYFDGHGYFFYSKLVYEIELINILKKNGFYIIYKAHPERPEGLAEFFKNMVDEIIFEKFENKNIQKKADAYFFSVMGSTAMSTALCSNKHIFLLDDTKFLFKDHLNSLKQRVNVIHCKFTKKYILNEKTIIRSINNPIKKINYDFIKKFLY